MKSPHNLEVPLCVFHLYEIEQQACITHMNRATNPFTGNLEIMTFQKYDRIAGWLRIDAKQLPLIWQFQGISALVSSANEVFYGGVVTEISSDNTLESIGYVYYTRESLFYIDKSSYGPDGKCLSHHRDRYRVRMQSDDNIFQYSLESVETEPEDLDRRVMIHS